MGLITAEAADGGSPLRVAEAVKDEVAAACAGGFGRMDMATLAHWLRAEGVS
jgi:hypothetical protein